MKLTEDSDSLRHYKTKYEHSPPSSSVSSHPSRSKGVTVAQLLSHVQLFTTPWTAAGQAPLSSTLSQSLFKFKSIESVMPSSPLILCRPLLLPSIFCSIGVFSSESALHIRWPKYWSFSIGPSSLYSGLTSFRIDCVDLFAVQGTLKGVFSSTTIQKYQFFST